jgi:hypothetical protein
MKNEMPSSLLLDEKICFIRLPLYTLQSDVEDVAIICDKV